MSSWIVHIKNWIVFRHESKDPEGAADVVAQTWKPLAVVFLGAATCFAIYQGGKFSLSYHEASLEYEEKKGQTSPNAQQSNRDSKRDSEKAVRKFDERYAMPEFKSPEPFFYFPKPQDQIIRPQSQGSKIAKLKNKNDAGTFNLEVPVQGDNDIRYKGEQKTYVRHGVRFVVYRVHCNNYFPMPEVCYLPQEMRPLVRGW